jgi:hypothetical protein
VTDTQIQRFDFDFDRRFKLLFRGAGISAQHSYVEVGHELLARLGPWRLRTGLGNVSSVSFTGPYSWYLVMGIRLSLKDRGITFGTNSSAGLCIEFRRPVRSFMQIAHPAMTVTVRDPGALRDALEARVAEPGGEGA